MTTPATLILNKNAGNTDKVDSAELLTILGEIGFAAECRETESEAELDEVLSHAQGLVIAAGGDGTLPRSGAAACGQKGSAGADPIGHGQ